MTGKMLITSDVVVVHNTVSIEPRIVDGPGSYQDLVGSS